MVRLLAIFASWALAASEADYYRIRTVQAPPGLQLEVSGIAVMPDGRIACTIRKGEVWLLADSASDSPHFHRFASGLHEPLGIAWHDGHLYVVQRSEVTKLVDSDGDDVADGYLTAAKGWGVSGNYHEYAYGPSFDADGNFVVTLNASIGPSLNDRKDWRGWSLQFAPDGGMTPLSGGMRSPIGIGRNQLGDLFGTDHQGNWFPTCPLYHIRKGVFHGHVDALPWCALPEASFAHPGKLSTGLTVGEAAKKIGAYVLPAVWFPYEKMGQGATGIACDRSDGMFGPFANQLFVGDFTLSMVLRVFLEQVDGEYQGACFRFREGFQSAVLMPAFGADGQMLVGESNRGWNSLGTRSFGLERVEWTGKVPFEIQEMRARSDGFELVFTAPASSETASEPASYVMISYTYPYHSRYGGKEADVKNLKIRTVALSPDGLRARLRIDGLRASYVHELSAPGLRARDGRPLLHAMACYTLNTIPGAP
jgi:hypothetical protein